MAKGRQILNRTFWYRSRSTAAWRTGQTGYVCLLGRLNWPASAASEILIILRNAECPRLAVVLTVSSKSPLSLDAERHPDKG